MGSRKEILVGNMGSHNKILVRNMGSNKESYVTCGSDFLG